MANDLTEKKERYIPYLLYWPGQGPERISTRKHLIDTLGAMCFKLYGKNATWLSEDGINLLLATCKVDAEGCRSYTFPADSDVLPGTKIIQFKNDKLQKEKYIEDTIAFSFCEG